jgi:hypothetical protein
MRTRGACCLRILRSKFRCAWWRKEEHDAVFIVWLALFVLFGRERGVCGKTDVEELKCFIFKMFE